MPQGDTDSRPPCSASSNAMTSRGIMKKVWTGVRCAHLRIWALSGLRVSNMELASYIGACLR
jgi:hypothetical protein